MTFGFPATPHIHLLVPSKERRGSAGVRTRTHVSLLLEPPSGELCISLSSSSEIDLRSTKGLLPLVTVVK